ncbi:MAG: AEC family transporter [Acidobacteria bacterium]|nr:AEC family transporter [Acidobacteriota bacterium]
MSAIAAILFPIFAVILCGYAAGRFGVLGRGGAESLNTFVYYFALPPLLFQLTAQAGVREILNWPFLFAFLGGVLVTLAAALAGGYLLFGRRGLALCFHGFAAVFGNTAYMGVPLFVAAFGPRGALPAIVATVASNLLLIGGAVAAAELDRSPVRALRNAALAVLRNPLLLAPLLGILVSHLGVTPPKPAAALLDLMAAAAVPAALFAIGLSLAEQPLDSGAGEVGWLCALKLVVQPAATWVLATAVFAPDPLWAKAAVLLAGMPVGALVFVITRRYGTYYQRASASVVVSTLLSMFSLAAWLALLGATRP